MKSKNCMFLAVLALSTSALMPQALQAQSALGLTAVGSTSNEDERGPRGVAPNNEWAVGTQFGVRLYGNGDFADNLLASGLIRYEIPLSSTKLGLPVFSNLADIAAKSVEGSKADSLKGAVNALLSTSQGVNLGVYPYAVLSPSPTNADVRITAFGQVVGKINSLEGDASLTAPDTAPKVRHTLLQGRTALGIEVAIGKPGDGRRPLTVSLTGVATTFSGRTYELIFGERKSWLPSIEFSAVIPVRDGAGVLIEGIGARGHAAAWRIAMVVAASTQGEEQEEDELENRDPLTPDQCLAIARANAEKEVNDIADLEDRDRARAEKLTEVALKARPEYEACIRELSN